MSHFNVTVACKAGPFFCRDIIFMILARNPNDRLIPKSEHITMDNRHSLMSLTHYQLPAKWNYNFTVIATNLLCYCECYYFCNQVLYVKLPELYKNLNVWWTYVVGQSFQRTILSLCTCFHFNLKRVQYWKIREYFRHLNRNPITQGLTDSEIDIPKIFPRTSPADPKGDVAESSESVIVANSLLLRSIALNRNAVLSKHNTYNVENSFTSVSGPDKVS